MDSAAKKSLSEVGGISASADAVPTGIGRYLSGHGRDGPKNFLRNFRGYLQADAAPIYDGLFNHPRQLILEVGCWMHGRRNFFEDRATDRPRAELVLARIGQRYEVERDPR